MSAIDQAFIRAYQPNAPALVPPPAKSTASPAAIKVATPASQPSVTTEQKSSERRPLSSFAATPATVEATFQPGLEVDRFAWSPVCQQLTAAGESYWTQLTETLVAADNAGQSLVGVAGINEGVGCTTLLLCIARSLVEAGKTVAIVDGNFSHPGVAQALGLGVELGWEDVLAGDVNLADGVVASLEDGIALLPLTRGGLRAAEKLDSIHASITAGVLRYHYDLVLVDLGSLANRQQTTFAEKIAEQCRLDAALLVTPDARYAQAHAGQLAQSAPKLTAAMLGTLENQVALAAAG